MKIEGKVAVVTGAASGIGEATALELAKRRVKALAVVDRNDRVFEVAKGVNDRVGRPGGGPSGC
jgi:NAD(P)-dependent dehydrogenase (short-subunit alcohol dehydrogenase family)